MHKYTLSGHVPASNDKLALLLAYTYRHLPTPLIYETGILGPVAIRLEGNIAVRSQLGVMLRENGLELV